MLINENTSRSTTGKIILRKQWRRSLTSTAARELCLLRNQSFNNLNQHIHSGSSSRRKSREKSAPYLNASFVFSFLFFFSCSYNVNGINVVILTNKTPSMTTLTSKLQDVTKQFQHLTVWRPGEQDPFVELDRWRDETHGAIEQIYQKKRMEIELIIEKHEREFMRQLVRQRTLLESIRKRFPVQHDRGQPVRIQNEPSILSDLNKMEEDIRTKLGRGEVLLQIVPFDFNGSVIIHLKTYFAHTSSTHRTELLDINPPTPKRTASRGFDHWLHDKDKQRKIAEEKVRATKKQGKERDSADPHTKMLRNQIAYDQWRINKKHTNASIKRVVIDDAKSQPELTSHAWLFLDDTFSFRNLSFFALLSIQRESLRECLSIRKSKPHLNVRSSLQGSYLRVTRGFFSQR